MDLGCVVAGTADKLDDALQIARTSDFDVALLDFNIGGKRVDPVAEAIRARGDRSRCGERDRKRVTTQDRSAAARPSREDRARYLFLPGRELYVGSAA
jgi:CheY-like chemotaxis protein